MGQSPKVIETKAKHKRDLIKLINFRTVKDTINQTKRQPIDWEKILAKYAAITDLIYKIYISYSLITTTIAKHTHTHTHRQSRNRWED